MTTFYFTPNLVTKKSRVRNNTAKAILAHIKKHGEGYESIQKNCIPYYDFDASYDTESDRAANYQTDLDLALNSLKLKYPAGKIYEFNACGFDSDKNKYKNSFHFKIRGAGYHNTASEVPKIDCFDPAVYNNGSQLFRLPYCSKKNQKRFLKRFDSSTGKIYELDELKDLQEDFSEYLVQNISDEELNENLEIKEPTESPEENLSTADIDIDFYINKIKQNSKILDNMKFKNYKEFDNKIIINFRRTASEYCDTCERTHDCDATPYVTVLLKSNKIFYACIRNKQSIFICKVDDTKPCVDAIKIDKLVKIGTKVNQQYCADIPEFMDSILAKKHGTIIIKSNMGTGKTYAVAKAINEKNCQLPCKTGVISFRISLAKKYTEDFHGFTNYSDVKERVIDVHNWVCQLDSLYRIKPQVLDYLVLDEVSQIRKHLTATTFMSNKNFLQNRAALRYNIRTAGQVIIMDANVTQADREWLSSMRVAEELIIVNEYVKGGVEIVFNSKSQIIKRIKDDFDDGRRCIVAHNGAAEKQLALAKQITNNSADTDKILVINSITMAEDNVKAALNSPNTEFSKYRVVIMSPTAQSGLSYDIPDIFHSIYGIFGNASNSSGDACQMLNRVRHPISKKQYVCIDQYNFGDVKPTNAKDMKNYLMNSKSHIFKKKYDVDVLSIIERIPFDYNDLGEIEFAESELINEFCINKAEHNLDSICYKQNFIAHQLSYGNTIIDNKKKDGEIEKKITKETKESVMVVLNDIATEIHDSPDLNDTTADNLKQKIKDNPETISKIEYNSIKKYNVKKFYKMNAMNAVLEKPPKMNLDVEWFKTYTDTTVKKYYYNQDLYINKSNEDGLKQLKKREIINNVYCGVKDGADPEKKSTDQYIVDTVLTKSRYIKHKILIGWLEELNYTGLNDTRKTDVKDLKNLLIQLKNNLTESTFQKLGKKNKNLEKIKSWDINDSSFLKNMLRFINGSLKSEFGITIKKVGVNSNDYELDNKYAGGIFKVYELKDSYTNNSVNTVLEKPPDNRPILGMNTMNEMKDAHRYNSDDEPYDSDDDE